MVDTKMEIADLAQRGSFQDLDELTRMDVPEEVRELIASQPGYSAESGPYQVAKTAQGGYRLYVRVDGKYMDASLADIC